MPGTLDFDVSFNRQGRSGAVEKAEALRILVLGDFTGHRSADFQAGARKPLSVDMDNLEERLQRLNPSLNLHLPSDPGTSIQLTFQELEDFHPDRIYDQVAVFKELRELRRDLLNPATFPDAARKIQPEEGSTASPEPTSPSPSPGKDSFADLLGKPVQQDRSPTQHPAVANLIRRVIAPHIVDEPSPDQDLLVESVDQSVSSQMKEILHHPDFRALESTWKGLDFLIRSLELGSEMSLAIVDISKSQLESDLAQPDPKNDSILYKTLVTDAGDTIGTDPWGLVVGLYDIQPRDAKLLQSIGSLAAQAGSPFVSGISYANLPAAEDDEWNELRQSRAGSYINLCSPGILLRLPYGENTDEIERFEFEEMAQGPEFENYLWGNAGLLCAVLAGQTFLREGPNFRLGSLARIDGLPVHHYKIDGEYHMTPCGGRWISDSEADRMANLGLMPVLSIKNSDSVQINRFQSLAGGEIFAG